MSNLAINGGHKLITEEFQTFNFIGDAEISAATEVMRSGMLSKFVGDWEPDFYGGNKVQELEKAWADYFKVKHAISVNSWTSGLICAVGCLDIEPQDEVILPPWTMAATASAVLVWNAIPVFCDIDPEKFTLDPKKIEAAITDRTKAILTVDIHGMSSDIDEIMEIAERYNLKVISDSAQAIGSTYKNRYTGTLSHIGGYSLNRFKHIQTGEGGIIVTNDDNLADRMKMIRNHADAVAYRRGQENIKNLIGFNFRMGEIEAAIAVEQLKKLEDIVKSRQKVACAFTEGLSGLVGLRIPEIPNDRSHSFYTYPILIEEERTGVEARKICAALQAEGVSIGSSYINLHRYPTYQRKIAYGSNGFPWRSALHASDVSYQIGTLPVAEKYNSNGYLTMEMCNYMYTENEITQVLNAFYKVWNNLSELK